MINKLAWEAFDKLKSSKYTENVEQYIKLVRSVELAKKTVLEVSDKDYLENESVSNDLEILFKNLVQVEASLHMYTLLQ